MNNTEYRKIVNNLVLAIPQYPDEISRKELCNKIGIRSDLFDSYMCSATYVANIAEYNGMFTRCEEYYTKRIREIEGN